MLSTSSPDDGLVSQSTHSSKIWVVHTSSIDLSQDASKITLHKNNHIPGFHSNVIQSLLHWYTYRGDQIHWSFWVPGFLYPSYSFLHCGAPYKNNRWGNRDSYLNGTVSRFLSPRSIDLWDWWQHTETGTERLPCHKACDEVTRYVKKSRGGECRMALPSDIHISIAMN